MPVLPVPVNARSGVERSPVTMGVCAATTPSENAATAIARPTCRLINPPERLSSPHSATGRPGLLHFAQQERDNPLERIEPKCLGHRWAEVRVRVDVIEHATTVGRFQIFDATDV